MGCGRGRRFLCIRIACVCICWDYKVEVFRGCGVLLFDYVRVYTLRNEVKIAMDISIFLYLWGNSRQYLSVVDVQMKQNRSYVIFFISFNLFLVFHYVYQVSKIKKETLLNNLFFI